MLRFGLSSYVLGNVTFCGPTLCAPAGVENRDTVVELWPRPGRECNLHTLAAVDRVPFSRVAQWVYGTRNFFPINAPGMGRFQLLNLGGLGYGLELRFWVVIAIIVSLTLTITLITTLTII